MVSTVLIPSKIQLNSHFLTLNCAPRALSVVRFLTGFVLFTPLLCDRFITSKAVMTSRLNSSFLPLTFFSLLLALSLTWLHAAAAADRANSIPVQITHAQNFDPFPSPDGKKLVFISMLSGKEQLFTMDVDGSNIVQLTRDDADHEDPAWSPDGTRIAFLPITKDRHTIAVMRIDGSNVEGLTPPAQNTIHPNWPADSKRAIYGTHADLAPPKKNSANINAVDLDTKKIASLITDGVHNHRPGEAHMKKIQ